MQALRGFKQGRFSRAVWGGLLAIGLAACTTSIDEDDVELGESEQHAVAPCTAVTLVTPLNNQSGQVNVAMTISASATCPATHEFQYWVKPTSQQTWIILNPVFVSGSLDWLPPSAGAWNVTAVVRAVGNTGFDKRANSRLVNISSGQVAPVANPDTATVAHASITGVTLDPRTNDTDGNNDPLSITAVTQGSGGAVTFTSTSVTYIPNANFAGPTDTFNYTISDGQGGTASSTVTVTITNNAPVAVDDTDSTHDTAATGNVLANDTDADSDTLTAALDTQATNGVASVSSDGSYSYTPTAGFVGTDSFTYTVSDGFGGSDIGSVTITVNNTAPIATDDTLTVQQNSSNNTGNVLGNDTDADSDVLSASLVSGPAHGTVSVQTDGSFAYTPTAGYSGPDSFTYEAADGFQGGVDTGTVNITVTPLAPACTVSITGPTTGVFGTQFQLTATASCTTGAAEVRWFRKIGNGTNTQIQGFSQTLTLNQTPNAIGNHAYTAEVRTVGTTSPTTLSNAHVVVVEDNVPQCTKVVLTVPTANSTHTANGTSTLTGVATCPVGTNVEYQYWFKSTATQVWTIIPGFVPGSGTWNVPAVPGPYHLTVVARAVGAHTGYQVRANSVLVTVVP